MSPDNLTVYESVPHCAACIADGTAKLTTLRRVYFISDGVGHVKIGYSLNVKTRLRELQRTTALPLKILHVEVGGSTREHALHQQFAKDRVHGEWFRLSPAITEYVSERITA